MPGKSFKPLRKGREIALCIGAHKVLLGDRKSRDYFDPSERAVVLNPETYYGENQEAWLRACHEGAHARQQSQGHLSFYFRYNYPRPILIICGGIIYLAGMKTTGLWVGLGAWFLGWLIILWNEAEASYIAYHWMKARGLLKNPSHAFFYFLKNTLSYLFSTWM